MKGKLNMFVTREDERRQLINAYKSDRSKFIAIYAWLFGQTPHFEALGRVSRPSPASADVNRPWLSATTSYLSTRRGT